MKLSEIKNLHERAVSQVKNLTENNQEDVTQNDDYVKVISKLTIEAMMHHLFNITDCTLRFLEEFQHKAKSDVDNSLIEIVKSNRNDLVKIYLRLGNEYNEIYESELN